MSMSVEMKDNILPTRYSEEPHSIKQFGYSIKSVKLQHDLLNVLSGALNLSENRKKTTSLRAKRSNLID